MRTLGRALLAALALACLAAMVPSPASASPRLAQRGDTAGSADSDRRATKADKDRAEGEAVDAEEAADRRALDLARASLRLARNYYDRGEFERAVEVFESILGTPVQLSRREDLHEGFLYYAFTLFLQGRQEDAKDKVRYALRLDPDFEPSPVTTRPDLLGFYLDEQALWRGTKPSTPEPLGTIFPELQETPGSTAVLRRRVFFPFFGFGLRSLGHRQIGDAVLVTELFTFGVNAASFVLRGAAFNDLSQRGWTVTRLGRTLNYVSFGLFWAEILVEFVASLALRARYQRFPELRPDARVRAARRGAKPTHFGMGKEGLAVQFW